jgi:hypothetical protein
VKLDGESAVRNFWQEERPPMMMKASMICILFMADAFE